MAFSCINGVELSLLSTYFNYLLLHQSANIVGVYIVQLLGPFNRLLYAIQFSINFPLSQFKMELDALQRNFYGVAWANLKYEMQANIKRNAEAIR